MGTPGRLRAAVAGGAAALVWALQEPLDQRVFGCDYSDVALIGKGVTRGRGWRPIGLAIHLANGSLFGLGYRAARRTLPGAPPAVLGVGMAVAENTVLYPLCYLIDRRHPARGEAGVPRLLTRRAFAQSTWRHALFGTVIARLAC
jgi:hypothetical protein